MYERRMEKEKELSEFETEVLYLLDVNCREKVTKLAKKLGTTPQRLEYTINKLEKDGVIIRYMAVVDYSKLGPYNYYVYAIKFKLISKKELIQKFRQITNEKACTFLFHLQGEIDCLIGTLGRDAHEAEQNMDELLQRFEGQIKYKKLMIFTRIHNQYRNYLLNSISDVKKISNLIINKPKNVIELMGVRQKIEKIDQEEEKIIKLLSMNGRMKVVDIAKKLQLTPETVWYKIKNLEKRKIIIAYDLHLQPNRYNHKLCFLEIYIKDAKKLYTQEIVNFLKTSNIVYKIIELMGNDFILSMLVFQKEEQKEELIEKIIDKFKTKIEDIKLHPTLYVYKIQYYFGE
ncbi:MAG: Lrp/AsnC family transcriptional regulator [Candidatus Micrarchaeota archaeon]|nr:Lrp/AsnC family transcriptional regulator [Candidatus Micrarchaeota archaeon]